jgi:hypothetical protein
LVAVTTRTGGYMPKRRRGVGYQMALLVARAGDVLTPGLRAELQAALPR